MDTKTQGALDRLLELAQGDTGQARLVADFVLAWWSADEMGGFDLTHLWNVDTAISDDMLTVMTFLASPTGRVYPDKHKSHIVRLIELWRPEVWARINEDA